MLPDGGEDAGTTDGRGYLVDTSVIARLPTDEQVRRELLFLTRRYTARRIHVCPPVVIEVGFMARNGKDHRLVAEQLSHFAPCGVSPTNEQTLSLQHALWSTGLVRAAGAMDTLIAAFAMVNHLTVLHYDSNFEHIATAVPGFTHRWIVPRSTAGA